MFKERFIFILKIITILLRTVLQKNLSVLRLKKLDMQKIYAVNGAKIMKNKNISFNDMFKDDLKDPEFVALAEKEELKAQIADFLVEERKEKT